MTEAQRLTIRREGEYLTHVGRLFHAIAGAASSSGNPWIDQMNDEHVKWVVFQVIAAARDAGLIKSKGLGGARHYEIVREL